jgi:hypothetical protein
MPSPGDVEPADFVVGAERDRVCRGVGVAKRCLTLGVAEGEVTVIVSPAMASAEADHDPSSVSWMQSRIFSRIVFVCVVAFVAAAGSVVGIASAAAQSSGEVDAIVDQLQDDGVYVELGGEGSESQLSRTVSDASSDGVNLSIVSLATSPAAESLARELSGRVGGVVLVITPSEIAGWSADHSSADVNRALDVSFSKFSGSITAGAESFASSMAGVSTPSAAGTTDSGSVGEPASGGGADVLIFFVVVIGGIVALVLFVRSRNRKKVKGEMGERREQVGRELAELGGEIYEMADTVTFTDNDEATDHFRQGNEQYLELQDDLENATTLWEITKIDYAADTAAWHLDAAEAIIAGEKVPDEPDRPDLRVSRPSGPNLPKPPVQQAPPSPRVEPRQRRRTDWNSPRTRGGGLSGGLGDLVSGVLVGGVLRGGGRSGGRRRAPRGWSGGGNLGSGGGLGSLGRSSGGTRGGGGSRSRGGGGASRRR